MDVLRPFRALLGRQRDEAERQLRDQADAQRRLDQTIAQYKQLLADPRYALIQEDAQRILNEEVKRLISHAAQCPHCCGLAERVRMITEVVLLPPQLVSYDRATQHAKREGGNGEAEVMELVDD